MLLDSAIKPIPLSHSKIEKANKTKSHFSSTTRPKSKLRSKFRQTRSDPAIPPEIATFARLKTHRKRERLTPRNAERAEIGLEAVEPEEAGAGDGVVGVGDADDVAGVADRGRDEEEGEEAEEDAGPGADVVHLGEVVGDPGGEDGGAVLLLGLGLVGGEGGGVPVASAAAAFAVVGVRRGSAHGEDSLEHGGGAKEGEK